MLPLSESQRSACLAAVAGIATNLVETAKAHRAELYWDPGSLAKSSHDRRALEASLGFGTPGILWFLAEYHRATGDATVLPCIEAALPRLRRLLVHPSAAATHGFYTGVLGSAHALWQVQQLTGIGWGADSLRALVTTAIESLAARGGPASTGLSNGIAGSLLALHLLAGVVGSETLGTYRDVFLRQLLHGLRVAETGVACGRHFDAIRSPVGFFSGGAGVRYALAAIARHSPGWAWIIAQLDDYENSAFDPATGNWHDYVHEDFFNADGQAPRLNRAVAREQVEKFDQPGDTLWWGAGTAGIIIGHLPAGPEKTVPAETDLVALRRGVARIGRGVAQLDPETALFTLYDGWAGVGLSLLHGLAAVSDPSAQSVAETIVAAACQQYERRQRLKTCAWNMAARLGLLVGEAGIGQFLLKLLAGEAENSVLRPQIKQEEPVSTAVAFDQADAARAIVANAFPLTARLLDPLPVPSEPTLTLRGCIHVLTAATRDDSAELVRDVLEYECTCHELERTAGPNLYLASREAFHEQTYATLLASPDNAPLLKGRFRRAAGLKLGALPFLLPREEAQPPQAGCTPVLIHARSDGAQTFILTREAYSVLMRLVRPASARELVDAGMDQWPLVEYSRDEATTLVLQILRAGIADGYIVRIGDA